MDLASSFAEHLRIGEQTMNSNEHRAEAERLLIRAYKFHQGGRDMPSDPAGQAADIAAAHVHALLASFPDVPVPLTPEQVEQQLSCTHMHPVEDPIFDAYQTRTYTCEDCGLNLGEYPRNHPDFVVMHNGGCECDGCKAAKARLDSGTVPNYHIVYAR
jgi:hypothetical protein